MGEAIITRRGGGSGLQYFFGDGSDGSLNTSGDTTLTSTLNGDMVIKQYTSITINAGHTLTVSNPCQGLILYSQGDVIINGTIDMSKKAGLTPVQLPPFYLGKATIELNETIRNLLGGSGGNGGYGGFIDGWPSSRATGGSGGLGRICLGGFGGGGGGGGTQTYEGRSGGSITNRNIAGGRILTQGIVNARENPASDGFNGCGGNGRSWAYRSVDRVALQRIGIANGGGSGGGGGAYNYYSDEAVTQEGSADSEYAGGFLMIIANGSISIGATATIKANGGNGSKGGNGTTSGYSASGGGGGGGSGGGVVAIYHKGVFVNNGSIQVNGGLGGIGGTKIGSGSPPSVENGGTGTSGSVGTIHIQKI